MLRLSSTLRVVLCGADGRELSALALKRVCTATWGSQVLSLRMMLTIP